MRHLTVIAKLAAEGTCRDSILSYLQAEQQGLSKASALLPGLFMKWAFAVSLIACVLQVEKDIEAAQSHIRKYSQQWQSSLLTLQKQDAKISVSPAIRAKS